MHVGLHSLGATSKDDSMTSPTQTGLRAGDTVLFIGDSITDAGRNRQDTSPPLSSARATLTWV